MIDAKENIVARYGALLAIYGPLLNDDGRELMQLYYDEDYSLAEIAAARSLSRQAVSGALQRQRRLLDRYDAVLGMVEREHWLEARLSDIEALLATDQKNDAVRLLAETRQRLKDI